MTVTLTHHSEEIIQDQISSGAARSPEEAIERALENWAENSQRYWPLGPASTPAEAVEEIRKLRKGVTLGGIKIKDLVNEGRKY
jgi:Arc/MetJ-type ribon-helix-helix transcriptional regulator